MGPSVHIHPMMVNGLSSARLSAFAAAGPTCSHTPHRGRCVMALQLALQNYPAILITEGKIIQHVHELACLVSTDIRLCSLKGRRAHSGAKYQKAVLGLSLYKGWMMEMAAMVMPPGKATRMSRRAHICNASIQRHISALWTLTTPATPVPWDITCQ
jgi:hypothetical protein